MIEPGATAKLNNWQTNPGQVGWGSYETMVSAIESAVRDRQYLLGDSFSMADVIFGGTVRYMLLFKLLEPRPLITAYCERLAARPALQRADARNTAIIEERAIGR